MLIAMTYQVGLFLAVCFGHGAGHVIAKHLGIYEKEDVPELPVSTNDPVPDNGETKEIVGVAPPGQ